METWIGFLVAGLALTGSPGPNTLSLAAVGAAFGRRRGIAYMLGLDLGMVVVIALVGSGISGLLLAAPGAAPVVAAVAAAYFVYLAYRIATAPPLGDDAGAGKVPRWYEGVGLSLVNPKAYAAMSALFSGFTLIGGNLVADGAAKFLTLNAMIVAVNVGWLAAGAALTPHFRHARTSRALNIGFALLLLFSVAAALLI